VSKLRSSKDLYSTRDAKNNLQQETSSWKAFFTHDKAPRYLLASMTGELFTTLEIREKLIEVRRTVGLLQLDYLGGALDLPCLLHVQRVQGPCCPSPLEGGYFSRSSTLMRLSLFGRRIRTDQSKTSRLFTA
jgi:hypothetical protein